MYLVYVLNVRGEFILYDSIPWADFSLDRVTHLQEELNDFYCDNDVNTYFYIDWARFVHDIRLYNQYVSGVTRIYYIDFPGDMHG